MSESKFFRIIKHRAIEVIARALDEFFRNTDIDALRKESIYLSTLIDLAATSRFQLCVWLYMRNALSLLKYLRENHLGLYNTLLYDDKEFSLLDCFVNFYELENEVFS